MRGASNSCQFYHCVVLEGPGRTQVARVHQFRADQQLTKKIPKNIRWLQNCFIWAEGQTLGAAIAREGTTGKRHPYRNNKHVSNIHSHTLQAMVLAGCARFWEHTPYKAPNVWVRMHTWRATGTEVVATRVTVEKAWECALPPLQGVPIPTQ